MTDTRVDPELLPFLDLYPPFDFSPERLPEIRRNALDAVPTGEPSQAVVFERLNVPGGAGGRGIAVFSYRPAGVGEPPVLLHMHGGGYVLGAPVMNDVRNRSVCEKVGCAIFSVDYALAPEAPFPAALEENYTVLKWLAKNAKALGVDAGRIVVGGESAGGGHAAALAIAARDRGEVALAGQMLTFPMLDDRTVLRVPASDPARPFHIWTPEDNAFGWRSYLGRPPGGGDVPALAAPARLDDFRGLPPAWIMCGALDLFLDETLDYGRRLAAADVPVELSIVPGAFHAFTLWPKAASARRAQQMYLDAMARLMGIG